MTQLPGLAGEIEEAIGLDAAVRLLRARGGTPIELPQNAAGSELCAILSEEELAQLIGHFGHGRLALPTAGLRGRAARDLDARARAMAMIDAGASNRQIALECGLTIRTVLKYRAARDEDEPQLSLPL